MEKTGWERVWESLGKNNWVRANVAARVIMILCAGIVLEASVSLFLIKTGGESICNGDAEGDCNEEEVVRNFVYGIATGAIGVVDALGGLVYTWCCGSQNSSRFCVASIDICTACLLAGDGAIVALLLYHGHNPSVTTRLWGRVVPAFFGFFVGIVKFIVMAKARVTQESAEGAAQDIELVAIDRQ